MVWKVDNTQNKVCVVAIKSFLEVQSKIPHIKKKKKILHECDFLSHKTITNLDYTDF